MDDKEFRQYLEKKDAETREDRVSRRRRLHSTSFGGELPELLWEYFTRAGQLYIDGQFPAVILWSATLLELILADKLVSHSKYAKTRVESLNLAEKTQCCCGSGLLATEDMSSIDHIRKLRNAIAHASMGKLDEMARRHYPDLDEASKVRTQLYLANIGGSLEEEALNSLMYTSNLVERWYGVKPSN